MKDAGWVRYKSTSNTDTIIEAFMVAVAKVRYVLRTMKVEFLPVSRTGFVIWSKGECKGFLSIEEVGPKTSSLALEGG